MKHSHDEEHGDDHDHADDDHSHDEEESECHTHDGVEHCHESEDDDHTHSGSEEIEDHTHADGEGEDCHTHDGVEHCHDGEAGHTHSAAESANAETTPRECHFHAGVEHCTGGTAQQQAATCERVDRDYNINLRIGLIFAMLAACAVAVYLPLFLKSFLNMDTSGLTFTIIKQFGTGVIVATAFVHLLTHANLMFSNDCLPPLKYEATTSAIAMAGAFIAFLIEYLGHRLATWRRGSIVAAQAHIDSEASDDNSAVNAKEAHSHSHSHEHSHTGVHHTHTHATDHATGIEGLSNRNNVIADAETCSIAPQDKFSVFVLEAGIIFHSILLGITLVVAGDSVFITLFIVILFHQMFEGLALGARIAALASPHVGHGLFSWTRVKNLVMPGIFAIITPIGMAIGIGVLQSFNGNDPSTIIALGTLDALSAGILLWVGLVGMWAHDWMFGELRDAGWKRTVPAMTALIAGLALMGILGKWA